MDKRNPSRNSKSEKERTHLRSFIKGLNAEDTTPQDSNYDPSNEVSDEKTSKKKGQKKRPKNIFRIISQHFKKQSGIYISLLATAFLALLVTPVIGLNREMGETKTELNNTKSLLEENKKMITSVQNDLNTTKNDFNSYKVNIAKYEGANTTHDSNKSDYYQQQITELIKAVGSIKTYLVTKFKAKFE